MNTLIKSPIKQLKECNKEYVRMYWEVSRRPFKSLHYAAQYFNFSAARFIDNNVFPMYLMGGEL